MARDRDDDGGGYSSFSDSAGRDDDDHDRDEREEEEEEEDRDDDDRGDRVRGRSRARDDDPELDDDDDRDDDDREEEEEEEEEALNPDDLAAIANGGGHVPYERLASVVDQNHRLTQALLDAQAAAAGPKKETPPPVDIAALREQYEDAVLEGDKAKSKTLSSQIDEALLQQAEDRALKRFEARQQVEAQERLQLEAAKASSIVLQKYPSLNDFETDRDAADDMERILVERDLLLRRGVPIGKAMRQAADFVMGGTGGERSSRERDRGARRDRDDRGGERPARRTTHADRLRERARTAGRLPPRTGDNGQGQRGRKEARGSLPSDRDVRDMSEAEKKRARGDFDV